MNFIYILVLLFGVFAFSRAFKRWRESKITLGEFLFWTGVWISAVGFAVFPGTLDLLSGKVGFRRGMDLIISLSIIVLFYLLFRIYVKIEEVEQNITKVVREVAIYRKK